LPWSANMCLKSVTVSALVPMCLYCVHNTKIPTPNATQNVFSPFLSSRSTTINTTPWDKRAKDFRCLHRCKLAAAWHVSMSNQQHATIIGLYKYTYSPSYLCFHTHKFQCPNWCTHTKPKHNHCSCT
jgi:hypothetical protein